MLDLDALETKAKAASPGPWRYGYEPGFCGELIDPDGEMIASFADEPAASDAEFIAAANPATVLEMIRELREARAAVAAEREACAAVCDMQAERNEEEAAGADEDEQSSLRASAWQMSVCAAAIRARGAKGGE